MKKIFLFFFLLICFLYVFIDSEDTSLYKKGCLKFGLLEKSKDYKDCYKSSDNFFKYGLNYNIDRIYSGSLKFNQNTSSINKNLIINKNNYKEVNLLDFIYENFETDISFKLKNKNKIENILKKKLKFKVAFYPNISSDDWYIHFVLPTREDKDKILSLSNVTIMSGFKSEYHNVEIKKKVSKLYENIGSLTYDLMYIEHTIYGYFDDTNTSKEIEDILGIRPVFYVEDIIFNEATLDKNKIKEILTIKHQKEKNKKNSK
jgi:hypothetical protein